MIAYLCKILYINIPSNILNKNFWRKAKFSKNIVHLYSPSSCGMCVWEISKTTYKIDLPRPDGSVASVSDSWPGGYEFDPWLKRLFFPAYFRLSPLQKHVRKVVGGFGKKSCVSTGVRKPGNTLCVTDRHDMTLAVEVELKPNTTNQPKLILYLTRCT